MTTAHASGCIKLQDNSENNFDNFDNFDNLRGLLPVVEDWHAKVCFMQVRISDPYIIAYTLFKVLLKFYIGDLQKALQDFI